MLDNLGYPKVSEIFIHIYMSCKASYRHANLSHPQEGTSIVCIAFVQSFEDLFVLPQQLQDLPRYTWSSTQDESDPRFINLIKAQKQTKTFVNHKYLYSLKRKRSSLMPLAVSPCPTHYHPLEYATLLGRVAGI
jgi:hypothetical protein